MVRDVNTVRVNEEACQRRFDAFSRLKFVSFFFLLSSHSLSSHSFRPFFLSLFLSSSVVVISG